MARFAQTTRCRFYLKYKDVENVEHVVDLIEDSQGMVINNLANTTLEISKDLQDFTDTEPRISFMYKAIGKNQPQRFVANRFHIAHDSVKHDRKFWTEYCLENSPLFLAFEDNTWVEMEGGAQRNVCILVPPPH